MSNPKCRIGDLVGKDLVGFQIRQLTEVYTVDMDGRYSTSLGFFKDPKIATAFAGTQTDASSHKTSLEYVLTDGNVGFLIDKPNPVILFDDEVVALETKRKVLAKLDPMERHILGFSD